MHVLVTGATGFIGFHTVLALLQAGHSVRLGVRNADKMRRLYQPLGIDTSDYSQGEITDRKVIEAALDGCDALVHTAALVSMDAGMAELMYHTNVNGTRQVIDRALERGCESIVHVSSAAALFDPDASVLDESLPPAEGASPYGRSKADSERYVREMIAAGANIAITYPTTVMGPMDPAMSEGNQGLALLFRIGLVRTSSGMQIIDVRDLARAHVALLERRAVGPFIVGGHYRSWDELARLLPQLCGRRMQQIPMPGWLLRALGSVVDVISSVLPLETPLTREGATYGTRWVYADDRKLRRELDMQFRPLEDTLCDTLRWMAQEGHIDPWWAENLPPDRGVYRPR